MVSWHICIVILCVLAVVEVVLNSTWNKFYFLYGIPVFRKTIEIQNLEKANTEITYLINHINSINAFKRYTGHIFNEQTFFFRKQILISGRNNFDDIKGSIYIDAENREIVVKGFLSYSYILALIVALLLFINLSDLVSGIILSVICIVGMILLSFVIGQRKYNLLVDEITERIK